MLFMIVAEVYNDLKKRFPDILWLPKDISNSYLLKLKNINFAISNYGSVLYEMAYLNKYSLSAGLNRTSSFSFTFNPKNILNYKKILIKLSKKTNNKQKKFYNWCSQNILHFLYARIRRHTKFC